MGDRSLSSSRSEGLQSRAIAHALVCVIGVLTTLDVSTASQRPLIGVLSQPGGAAPAGHTYIAASYVKQIEASGARAVPIECTSSVQEIRGIFDKVNGVVIPGGGTSKVPGHSYYEAVSLLLNLTKESNNQGRFYPLHGVCLGMEEMTIALTEPFNTSIITSFDAEDYPSTITLTSEAAYSPMFANISEHLKQAMQTEDIIMENHHWGVSYQAFLANSGLHDNFNVTSLGKDRDGKTFVATFESKKYPISATQFHPEKNAYEWTERLKIPHNQTAVDVSKAFGDFIVGQARKNNNSAGNDTNALMIWNYPIVFTGDIPGKDGKDSRFDQCYIIPNKNPALGPAIAPQQQARIAPASSVTLG